MPFGQLVDEAERAVVVARAHLVEHRAVELEAERRAGGLVDRDEVLEAAAADLELDDGLVGLELVADDVAHRLAVQAEDLVAGEDSRRRPPATRARPPRLGGRHVAIVGGHPTSRAGTLGACADERPEGRRR